MKGSTWRTMTTTALSIAMIVAVACAENAVEPIGGARSVQAAAGGGITLTISPPKAAILVGETLQLRYGLTNPAGKSVPSNRPIEWVSSDPKVASVDDGFVVGNSDGTATITATGANATGTAVIFVSSKGCKPPPAGESKEPAEPAPKPVPCPKK